MTRRGTRVPTSREMRRYGRQLALPGWGPEAQRRLAQATVSIAGLGGLGSPVAMYLAAAGVGTLRVWWGRPR